MSKREDLTRKEAKQADDLYYRLIVPIHNRFKKREDEIYNEMKECIDEKEEEIMELQTEIEKDIREGRKEIKKVLDQLSESEREILLFDTEVFGPIYPRNHKLPDVLTEIASRIPQ